jgi:hypothetical protein
MKMLGRPGESGNVGFERDQGNAPPEEPAGPTFNPDDDIPF